MDGTRALLVLVGLVGLMALGLCMALALRCHRLTGRLASAESARGEGTGRTAAPRPSSMEEYWYEEAKAARAAQHVLLDAVEARELRARGLADPVRDLRASLSTRASMLPFQREPATVESGWHFVPESIAPLNDRWAFARFENGHETGSCLLEYEIRRGGRVRWRLLHAGLDGPVRVALP